MKQSRRQLLKTAAITSAVIALSNNTPAQSSSISGLHQSVGVVISLIGDGVATHFERNFADIVWVQQGFSSLPTVPSGVFITAAQDQNANPYTGATAAIQGSKLIIDIPPGITFTQISMGLVF